VRAVVTGGRGFLGRRLVELLRDRGDEVRVLARRRHPALDGLGASTVPADVRDTLAVRRAVAGADVVFHLAGRAGLWGAEAEHWSVNLEGTRSVLRAMRAEGVSLLVYTSTPSVVGYETDIEGGGPDLPYAAVHQSPYAASKAAAERLVLAANGPDLRTVALRPHLIFGPGDRRMLPPVIARAARGRLRVIGDGRNRVDLTYIDNAAWAQLDAARALGRPGAECAGRPYFITNGEPVQLWPWLNEVLAGLDLPPVTRVLPFPAARLASGVLELVWRTFRLRGEPPITRFLASALARSHWYDPGPARRDLGYRARVSMAEATRRTVCWLSGRAGVTPGPSPLVLERTT
jgi:nucleoside-diphosphate-sugar epimerase